VTCIRVLLVVLASSLAVSSQAQQLVIAQSEPRTTLDVILNDLQYQIVGIVARCGSGPEVDRLWETVGKLQQAATAVLGRPPEIDIVLGHCYSRNADEAEADKYYQRAKKLVRKGYREIDRMKKAQQ